MKTYTLKSTEATRISRYMAPKPPWILEDDDENALARLERSCQTNLVEMKQDVGVFEGSGKKPYHTNITGCECRDYIMNKKPCKHMYRIGVQQGIVFVGDQQVSYITDNSTNTIKLNIEIKKQTQEATRPHPNRASLPKKPKKEDTPTPYEQWLYAIDYALDLEVLGTHDNNFIIQDNNTNSQYLTNLSLEQCSCPEEGPICVHRVRAAIEQEAIGHNPDVQIIYTPWGEISNE